MDKKQIIEDYLQGCHPIEQQSWELPTDIELDNAEAEFDRLRKKTPLHHGRGWRWGFFAVAACLVGFVVIFLAPPKSTEEQLPLALEEPMVNEQLPVMAEVTPQQQVPTDKPQQPDDSHKTRKSYENNKPKQPAEIQQEESPLTNHFLAEAQSVLLPESDGQREELDLEASILPPDRQALVDIYLAEEALQVTYMQQEQMQELRAFTAGLQGKEPETSHLITAF
jgi:hypothetical protein